MIGGNNVALTAVIKAKDEASGVFNSVGKSSNALKGGLVKLGIAGAAAVGATAVGSVKMASDFEKSMTEVSTLVDTSKESMKEMSDEVLEIAKRVPVGVGELSGALYDVRSAGVSAGDAMMVLEKSAMLGMTGLGTTKEAAKLATGAINSFNLEGEEAAKVFDTIQLTVKSGITNIPALTQSFGLVAGVAGKAGVSFEELMAATAALTTTTTPASVAQTQLRSAILSIQAPTSDMAEIIDDLGYKSGSAMIEQLGLVGSMEAIDKAAGGDIEILKKAYGSVEALGSALSLTGEQGDAFADTLAEMKDGSGALDEEFAKIQDSFDFAWKTLKENLNVEMVKLGTELLPDIIERIPDIIKVVEATFNGLEKIMDTALWLMDTAEKVANFFGEKPYDKASSAYREEYSYDGKKKLVLKDVYRDDFVPDGSLRDVLKQQEGYKDDSYLLENKNKENVTVNLDLRGSTVTDEEITNKLSDLIIKKVNHSQLAR